MNDNLKTGIYIRVSTEDQAKDGFSIPAQKEKLTKQIFQNFQMSQKMIAKTKTAVQLFLSLIVKLKI